MKVVEAKGGVFFMQSYMTIQLSMTTSCHPGSFYFIERIGKEYVFQNKAEHSGKSNDVYLKGWISQ